MLNLTEKIYSALPDCVTDAELLVLLGPDTNENARYGKVKRAMAVVVIQLRAVYSRCLRYQRRPVNLLKSPSGFTAPLTSVLSRAVASWLDSRSGANNHVRDI